MDPQPVKAQSIRPVKKLVFRTRHRIAGSDQFAAVFEAKVRKSRGVLTVFLMPTDFPEHRLGLSVGKRVGNAVVRGRFKRMMREAFRQQRGELPTPSAGRAYDIVVTSRKHDVVSLEAYTRMFIDAVEAAHRTHEKRLDK